MATNSYVHRFFNKVVLLPLLAAALTSPQTFAAEGILLDRMAAIVNDDIILESELEQEISQVRAKIAQVNAPELSHAQLKKQSMERLVVHKLQLAEAASAGIGVSDESLLKAINNIAKRNKLTVDEMEQMLQSEGMSVAIYRDNLRDQIILSRLRNREVMSRIQITDAEIDNYLQHSDQQPGGRTALHVRHILIATPEGASSDEIQTASSRAENLVENLRKGSDFASAATQHSAGRQALDGGDLGWQEAEKLPSLFTAETVSMQRGDIAGPMQTASGFHIIKLEDFKGGEKQIIKQTHVRHILIRTNELTSDHDAKTRLQQLYQRIENGEDFDSLARTNSDDKASAIKGGDLDWISPGSLVSRFEEQMDSLEIDQISEPFQSEFGWHIVQVLDRREHDVTDDTRRDKIRNVLRAQRGEEALELYIRKLRDQAYVDIRPEDF